MTLVPVETGAIDVVHRPTLGTAELDTLRRTICHDLDPNEFELFAAICRRTGLDPITKQIYAVKRYDGRQKREVMQVQTGIDGFRVIAERSGNYGGPAPTFWCGDDGVWVDVWLSDKPPAAAKAGVWRKGFAEPVYAVAKTSSYMATNRDGSPQAMWRTMPEVMIAKCAESLAMRRAFPNDMSGVYTQEEMGQQDNTTGPPLASTEQVDKIDVLLPQVPEAAMPALKAWKAEQGISMKAGEFTAEHADMVIDHLEAAIKMSDGGGHVPPAPAVGDSQSDEGTPTGVPSGTHSAPSSAASPEPGGEAVNRPSVDLPPSGPDTPTTLKATNEKAYQALNRYCRKVAADHFAEDKDTKATQWEALAWACSGGRTIHLGDLTPDEASDFRRRCQDVASGLARWVESDDPAHLGWTFDLTEEMA